MENRYLYRAKRLDNGEWVIGYLSYPCCTKKSAESYYFYAKDILGFYCRCIVDASTICQCTELKDKNGELIFENDIVDFLGHIGIVKFDCGSFGIAYKKQIDWDEIQANIMPITGCENTLYACENDNYISLWEIYWNFNDEDDSLSTVEVIGNTFDNPELLEV